MSLLTRMILDGSVLMYHAFCMRKSALDCRMCSFLLTDLWSVDERCSMAEYARDLTRDCSAHAHSAADVFAIFSKNSTDAPCC